VGHPALVSDICGMHADMNEKAKNGKPPTKCPNCGQDFPFCIELDVIDALRRPNRDALFEYGEFVCYGAKPELDSSVWPGRLPGMLSSFAGYFDTGAK
jgi:hypothetical protein